MADPRPLSRNLVYRGHNLTISKPAMQWLVEIRHLLPLNTVETLRGWDEDEVLGRAKTRIDDVLELRAPRAD